MSSRIVRALMVILLLLSVIQPIAAVAADGASFKITVDEAGPKTGEEIAVTIHGDQLENLFGFEINVAYSPDKLQFVSAKSLVGDGFGVPPIVKDGLITFAFTKVGATTPGINGKADLASLKFKAIESGETDVKLPRIKIVAKNNAASEITTNEQVQINVSTELKEELTFSDVAEDFWAREAISRAVSLGIVNGYPDGTFKPLNSITRAEFAVMFVRALDLPIDSQAVLSFMDRDDIGAWAKPSIASAVANGLVEGFPDGTFRPSNLITRTEMTVMAVRALKLSTNGADAGQHKFADDESIPAWASASVAAAYDAGIIRGVGNNRFMPEASASRAEAVTIILRILDYMQNNR